MDPGHSKGVPNRVCITTLPGHEAPRPTLQGPHYNAEQNKLIEEEVADLLQKGAVSHLVESQSKGGLYSNLFLVPPKDGGQRPVINLKALNQFVQPCHFKMEGIHTLRDLIKQGDWLAKVDLKDAYFDPKMPRRGNTSGS